MTPEQLHHESKKTEPEAIALIRTGDFYEAFHDDAKYIARTLGLPLTTRSKRDESPVPMAGFPFHQLDRFLAQIAANGRRVVVCSAD